MTDLNSGLSEAEAAACHAAGRGNLPPAAPSKTAGRIVAENLFTFFNLIFALLAAALVLVGSYVHLGFLVVALCNTAIGTVQQLRTRRALDRLTLVAARRVRCLRGGAWRELDAAQLVEGDIIELGSGDQVCADAVVRDGIAYANEALVTGEAEPLAKAVGEELLSGSFIAAGRCLAQLTRVGDQSYASRLTLAVKSETRAAKSEMMAAFDRLIRVIGLLLVPVGAALFCKQHFLLALPLREATEATVAALIGMIPEGLYLLTSVALAVSVRRLAQRRVLTQDLNCVETLARVDVLCVDKTGTITEPQMTAEDPFLLDPAAWPLAQVQAVMAAIYNGQTPENDTGRALAARFGAAPVPGWTVTARVPFQSLYKWGAVTLAGQGSFVIGAPDIIAGRRYAAIAAQAEPLLRAGVRVLLLAACADTPDPAVGLDPAAMHPIALLPLRNRVRPGTEEIFRWFAEQGVTVKVISGDNALAVSQVAAQAGVSGAQRWLDAAALPDETLAAAAADTTVFGRVTPEQKRTIVRALQSAGHTVAMTGDGVNDVLALKEADCGIAMASGVQAASQVAQLVLLDSDFAALPAVVAEGRRVINNIQRSASLFLVKNIFSLLLAVVSLFTPMAYPLEPLQLSLVGAVTIGIPSFVLALEPNHALIRGRFMARVMAAALPGGLTDFTLLLGMLFCGHWLGLGRGELSQLCMDILLVVGLCMLWRLCQPFTLPHKLLWGGMAALGTAGALAMHRLLALRSPTPVGVLLLALFAALAPLVLKGTYQLLRRLWPPLEARFFGSRTVDKAAPAR